MSISILIPRAALGSVFPVCGYDFKIFDAQNSREVRTHKLRWEFVRDDNRFPVNVSCDKRRL
jgi:hypothetical protein